MSQKKNTQIRDWFWEEIKNNPKKYSHIIMVATKPDIIKQAPLYLELKNRWECVILIHTGQHYDYNLSQWVLDEFQMKVDVSLNIHGNLHQKFAMVIERFWDFLWELTNTYKKNTYSLCSWWYYDCNHSW